MLFQRALKSRSTAQNQKQKVEKNKQLKKRKKTDMLESIDKQPGECVE